MSSPRDPTRGPGRLVSGTRGDASKLGPLELEPHVHLEPPGESRGTGARVRIDHSLAIRDGLEWRKWRITTRSMRLPPCHFSAAVREALRDSTTQDDLAIFCI